MSLTFYLKKADSDLANAKIIGVAPSVNRDTTVRTIRGKAFAYIGKDEKLYILPFFNSEITPESFRVQADTGYLSIKEIRLE